MESLLAEEEQPTMLFVGSQAVPDQEAADETARSLLGIGQQVGRYRIVAKLGEGGMGAVYLAEDQELGRQVALKVLSGRMAFDPEFQRRFRREARALAAITHPNIVTIYSVEHEGGLTQTGVVMGTIPYMSPEQVEGKPADHRTDIFSLGIILYEMATGDRPFQGESGPALMASILKDEPTLVSRRRPRFPARLAQIIARCLEKDPERRYPDAETLARDLAAVQGAVERHPILVSSLGALSALVPRARRWRLAAVASTLAVLVVLALALNDEAVERRLQAPAEAPEISSLAVLPLTNVSGDEEQGYLADGTTAVLINALSKLGNLDVVSHGSVMRFKGTEQPPQEIAGELEVDAVVEGSILRSGDQLRITAQLVHAESGVGL